MALNSMLFQNTPFNNTPKEGGDTPPINPQQMKDWNSYVDWLDTKGVKGSKQLDNADTSFKYLDQYIKENPTTSLHRGVIKPIQDEMSKLATSARALAQRQNDPNAKNIMTGTSINDGIPGSKTTSFKFPIMTETNTNNGMVTSQKNLGLVKGGLQPTGIGQSNMQQKIPKGVNIEQFYDAQGKPSGKGYKDPNTGDLVQLQN